MKTIKTIIEITCWLAMCFAMAVIFMVAWAEKRHQRIDVDCLPYANTHYTCWEDAR